MQNRWTTILAVWTGFGLVAAAQHHLTWAVSRGVDLPWATSLALQLPVAWLWALATPAIQRLGRRFPVTRDRWPASLAVHALVCAGFVFTLALGYTVYSSAVLPPPAPVPVLDRWLQVILAWALTDAVLYAAVLSVGYLGDHQRRLRERELRASRLETELAQAELRALRMQLQPHFLFNALHTIGALVRTGDRAHAVQVVTGLGEVLRRVLDGAAEQEVPLARELALVRSYLSIEQVRFRDRLAVSLEIPEGLEQALVPPLVLQPLVENAIRHGLEPHPGAGRLEIRALRENGRLRLVVTDNGAGWNGAATGPARPGVGLANTRARLERLYGADCSLTAGPDPARGYVAEVALPFRLETSGKEKQG